MRFRLVGMIHPLIQDEPNKAEILKTSEALSYEIAEIRILNKSV